MEVRGLRAVNREYTADLATAFATQVALAFERLWVTESLIDASLQDELTGLGNRRGASAALSRVAPGDAIVMLDLDNFKRVNDEFGHAAGDDVLRRLGAFLREMVREGDACARYGGEEFVLVLRTCRHAGTRHHRALPHRVERGRPGDHVQLRRRSCTFTGSRRGRR